MQPLELLDEATAPDGSDLKLTRRGNEYIILANGKTTLDLLPRDATVVVVAELLPAVVEWNRGVLGALAEYPLKDRRVRIEVGDVDAALRSVKDQFDAVLLDVDNGPAAFSTPENSRLYDDRGLAAVCGALRNGGVLAVWSAREDRKFEQRLRYCGFVVEVERVRGRLKKGGPRHTFWHINRHERHRPRNILSASF